MSRASYILIHQSRAGTAFPPVRGVPSMEEWAQLSSAPPASHGGSACSRSPAQPRRCPPVRARPTSKPSRPVSITGSRPMRNEATPYADQAVRPVAVAGAVDVTRPAEGYYRFRLRSGSVFGGVRIWYGAPLDPVTGEELDRSWRWQALFNGEPIDLDRVWPTCAGDPITEDEYQTYRARQQWAAQNAPRSAYADPRKRIDPLSTNDPQLF